MLFRRLLPVNGLFYFAYVTSTRVEDHLYIVLLSMTAFVFWNRF